MNKKLLFLVIAFLLVAPVQGALTDGLVSYWGLDSNTDPEPDSAGSNDGSYVDSPTYTTSGKIDGAYEFNGSNYLDCGTNASLRPDSSDFSISAWVKTTSSDTTHIIFGKGKAGVTDLVALTMSSSGSIIIGLEDDSGHSADSTDDGDTVNDGDWHYVIGVVDRTANTSTRYVDGVQTGTVDDISSLTGAISPTEEASIGIYEDGITYWSGTIDEVGFWNRTLTTDEITSLYNSGSGFNPYVKVYDYAREVINRTDRNISVAVNGTGGGFNNEIIWTAILTEKTGLFYTNTTDYIVAYGNFTTQTQVAMDVEGYTGSVNATDVYLDSAVGIYHLFQDSNLTFDSTANENNGTWVNATVPVLLLRLNETEGTNAEDDSGKGNNGTLVNAPTWGTGISGNAVEFDDDDNSVITLGNKVVDDLDKLTIVAWVNAREWGATGKNNVIYQERQSYPNTNFIFVTTPAGTNIHLEVAMGNGTAGDVVDYACGVLNTNQWYQVGFSFDEGDYAFYLDGDQVDSGTSTIKKIETGTPAYKNIGRFTTTISFNGSIDEVAIYNSSLTQQQITNLYETQKALFNPSIGEGLFYRGASFDSSERTFIKTSAITPTVDDLDAYTTLAFVKLDSLSSSALEVITFSPKSINPAGYGFGMVRQSGSAVVRCGHNTEFAELTIPDTDWHMIACAYDGTDLKSYLDGSLEDTDTITTGNADASDNSIYIGGVETSAALVFNGLIDEVRYYNVTLNESQIEALYNNSIQLNNLLDVEVTETAINISSAIPINGSNFNSTPIDVNLTVNSSVDFSCDLFLNGTLEDSGTYSAGANVAVNLNITPTSAGYWNYYVSCYRGFEVENSTTNEFIYDVTIPAIATNFFNNSVYYRDNLTAQFNLTDDVILNSVNITIDGVNKYLNESIGATTYQVNFTTIVSNLSVGTHNMTIKVADGHTREELKSTKAYNPTTSFFNNKAEYKIKAPYTTKTVKSYLEGMTRSTQAWEITPYKDKYTETVYLPNNKKSSIQVITESSEPMHIMTDPLGRYKGQWLIIGNEHWKDFVLKDEPQSKVSIELITPYKARTTITNIKNPEKLTFESLGDLNVYSETYKFNKINLTDTFSNPIINGYNIILNLTASFDNLSFNPENVTATATLQWNNTNQTATEIYFNQTDAKYNRVFVDPLPDFEGNIEHKWFFSMGNYTPVVLQTNLTNQTNVELIIAPCNATVNYTVLNITYRDEIGLAKIETNNTYVLAITDGTYSYPQTGTFLDNTSDHFCTNLNPANLTYNWDLSGKWTLSKPLYTTRVININSITPVAISNNPQTNTTYYLIKVANSSTITYNWITNSFQQVDGTMRIFSCGDNATLSLVESIPIINGLGTANIQLLTQAYYYDITYNGLLYTDTTAYSQCHVESLTERTYVIDTTEFDFSSYIGLHGLHCGLSKLNASAVNMTWNTNPGNASSVTACLRLYSNTGLGLNLLQTDCITSSVITNLSIDYTLVNTTGYIVMGVLQQGENEKVCYNQLAFNDKTESQFGIDGLLAGVLLIVAMALLLSRSGVLSIIGASAGLIGVFFLGIVEVGWLAIASCITILIISAAIGRSNSK